MKEMLLNVFISKKPLVSLPEFIYMMTAQDLLNLGFNQIGICTFKMTLKSGLSIVISPGKRHYVGDLYHQSTKENNLTLPREYKNKKEIEDLIAAL